VATQQKLSTKSAHRPASSGRLDPPRVGSEPCAHLCCMDTTAQRQTRPHPASEHSLAPVVTMSQLASQLGVGIQTIYDLRSQGRGPRGFRVGRELRFRVSEIDSWLAQMEADDADRHPKADR
jgi:excisionase family DNA binding protein